MPRSGLRNTRVARELSRYKRQYQPWRERGEKKIVIVGFHESKVTDGGWLRHLLTVMGGGDYFFMASYSVRSGTITSIHVNGPK